jgi:hypothetical protein
MDQSIPLPPTNAPVDLSAQIAQILQILQTQKPQTDVSQATPDQKAAGAKAVLPNPVPIVGQTKPIEPPKNSAFDNIMAFLGKPQANAPQQGDQGGVGKAISHGASILKLLGIL